MATTNCTTAQEPAAALTDLTTTAQVFGDSALFAVREGALGIHDALEAVSTMLATAKATATMAGVDADSPVMFGVSSQIEAAKAVVDSALGSMMRKSSQDTAPAPQSATQDDMDGPTHERLAAAVENMDMYAKDGFGKIEAIANLARKSLQLSETYRHPDDLAEALRSIAYVAMDIRSVIGVEAESVGANYVDEAEREASRARLDAMRASRVDRQT
jgi:hypothetical protein